MTRTIVAILALTPGVLFAQAHTPAQPSSTPVLQSALLQPVAFAATKASDNAAANTSSLRVSTGVVAPKLVQQVALQPLARTGTILAGDHTVVVGMTVDESGKPTNLSILQPLDPAIDEQVLAAVGKFRYQPGTLNGQPAAFPVRLHYTIENAAF